MIRANGPGGGAWGARLRLGLRIKLAPERLDLFGGCQAHHQSHSPSTPLQAHRRQGPLPPPALPGFLSTMAPSDFRAVRTLAARSGRYPDGADLPCRPYTLLQHAVASYPGGPDGCSCRSFPVHGSLPRDRGGSASTTSVFEACLAFNSLQPAGSLGRPRRPSSRGFDPAVAHRQSLVSFRAQSTWLVWSPPPLGI